MKTLLAAAVLALSAGIAPIGDPIITSGVVPPVYTLPLPNEDWQDHAARHFSMVDARPLEYGEVSLVTQWTSDTPTEGYSAQLTSPYEGGRVDIFKKAHEIEVVVSMALVHPPTE